MATKKTAKKTTTKKSKKTSSSSAKKSSIKKKKLVIGTPSFSKNGVVKKKTRKSKKVRYSDKELNDFEKIILDKLDKAKKELIYIKETLSKKNDSGTDNTSGNLKLIEDSSDTMEKENLSQLAGRQQKFIVQLEKALVRIKNKTYGICIETGTLIPKERLKLVPHTQHSIEAKLNKN